MRNNTRNNKNSRSFLASFFSQEFKAQNILASYKEVSNNQNKNEVIIFAREVNMKPYITRT